MGFRTVVLLENDLTHEWVEDSSLGRKIMEAQFTRKRAEFRGGKVLECAHADVQTLGVIDSYSFSPLAHTNWYRDQTPEQRNVQLLKDAAAKLGYRLVRKSK